MLQRLHQPRKHETLLRKPSLLPSQPPASHATSQLRRRLVNQQPKPSQPILPRLAPPHPSQSPPTTRRDTMRNMMRRIITLMEMRAMITLMMMRMIPVWHWRKTATILNSAVLRSHAATVVDGFHLPSVPSCLLVSSRLSTVISHSSAFVVPKNIHAFQTSFATWRPVQMRV
jgi:hypothetical protein